LALKGLAKDHKLCSAIGDHALRRFLDVLENDAEVDPDVVLHMVKTLDLLRNPEDGHPMKMLGPTYMDAVLQDNRAPQRWNCSAFWFCSNIRGRRRDSTPHTPDRAGGRSRDVG
jgi:hypothetical protein